MYQIIAGGLEGQIAMETCNSGTLQRLWFPYTETYHLRDVCFQETPTAHPFPLLWILILDYSRLHF